MRCRLSRLWLLVALAPAFAAAGALVGPGCGGGTAIYPCDDPIPGRLDHNGHPDPCCYVDPCHDVDAGIDGDAMTDARADAESNPDADGGPPASCTCVEIPPLGWFGPALLWRGPAGTAPTCPAAAPVTGYHGFADLVAGPPSCGTCSCGASTGACMLPAHMMASTTACSGATGTSTPFDPPAGWDGGCTQNDAIEGGSKSLTIDPLTVTAETCAPVTAPTASPTPPASWQTSILACVGVTYPVCGDQAHVCAPTAPASSTFRMCVFQPGDLGDAGCPPAYPDPFPVAGGFDDARSCSTCACGAPDGGSCTATLSAFNDHACTVPQISTTISSAGPGCFDILPGGAPLGSKSVAKFKYTPGPCAPSGAEPAGAVTPTAPATFCCLP